MRSPSLRFATAAACLIAVGATAQTPADPTTAVFARDRILQVDIQMAPNDWRDVRLSHRVQTEAGIPMPGDDGYPTRRGQVRIDGVLIGDVGIRKKGFIGSVVSTRPSLKVKFDEYTKNQTFSGLDGLTLNNNNQDHAFVQQYLAYDLYARAGVPASRANFAHVRVNGEDLGIYSNVEAVNKAFLRRAFGTDAGTLYESYAGDFADARFSQIVEKSGGRPQDRDRLVRLKALLATAGPVALSEVDALVDLDSFIRMWASESLIGHWDSYTANRNNYYVYVHPKTGKLHFIPWGPDAVFADPGPLQTKVVPKSFKAQGLLARRLWELPAIRERYRAVMRTLLAGPWTEARLRTDIATLQKMLQPQSTLIPEAVVRGTTAVDAFITGRRAEVEAELKEPAPVWPPDRASALNPTPFTMSGSFSAPWTATTPANPLMVPGTGTLDVQIGGQPTRFDRVASYSETHSQLGTGLAPIRAGYQNVVVSGLSGTRVWQVSLTIDPFQFGMGDLPVDVYAVWAIVVTTEAGSTTPPRVSLWGNLGTLHIDQASARAGGMVRGTFSLRGNAAP